MAGNMFGRDDNGGAVSGVECLVLRRVTFWVRRQSSSSKKQLVRNHQNREKDSRREILASSPFRLYC